MTIGNRPAVVFWVVGLGGCLLAAAGLRFYHLDFQSLWLDELFSVVFSHSGLSAPEIAATYADDVHPLGYPLILHFWLELFGDTAFAARALSAVFGVLGVAAVFAAGRRYFGTRAGLFAAVVTSVNAFHIAYSQEARAYSLVFLLSTVSYWAYLSVLERPAWRTAVGYGLATAATMHVHYYAFLLVFGQVAAALVLGGLRRWSWRQLWPLFAGAVGAGLTTVPWLGPMLKVAEMREYWPARPTPLFFLDYFHQYFGSHLILSLACGGLLIALPFIVFREPGDPDRTGPLDTRTKAGLLGGAVVIALFAAYLRSVLIVPMLIPRVTIVFLPAVLLLIALSLSRFKPAWVGVAVVSGLAVLSVWGLVQDGYYSEPTKEQWREAVEHMLSDSRFDTDSDVCLGSPALGFQFYVDQSGSPVVLEDAEPSRLAGILEDRGDVPAVWLLVARDETSVQGVRRELREGWVRTDRVKFLGTSVERWEPVIPDTREADSDEGTKR